MAKEIRIDIQTRILPADHQVFFARPGEEYRLYGDFLKASAIGPELPGIKIVRAPTFKNQPDLDNKLKLAMAVRRWAKQGRPAERIPSDDPADHAGERRTAGWAQFYSVLQAYFEVARKGDLLVIPPKAFVSDAVLVELTDEPTRSVNIKTQRWAPFTIPGRRFQPLATIPKRLLPTPILAVSAKPAPFTIVERSIRPALYDLAYGSYALADDYSARINVKDESFNTTDDVMLVAFLTFVAANTKSIVFDGTKRTYSVEQALFNFDLNEYAPDLRSNINSPGFLSLRSSFIIPVVSTIMLALALDVGAEAGQAAQNDRVVITNSKASADDPCTAQIADAVLTQLRLYGYDQWKLACEIARKAGRAGLGTTPTVTTTGK